MAARAARPPSVMTAFVLHHYDWSESSLILDLFTREQGRLAVVAKGAKRPYSQLRSVLLPFQRVQVSLGKPPKADGSGEATGEVQTLRAAEWAGGGPMLTGGAIFSGFYLNELLMKLLARGDPHPALFDCYAQTLPALAGDDLSAQAALRAFEVALLSQTGLLPDFSLVTLTQETVDPAARYAVLPEAGVTAPRSSADTPLPGQVLIGLQAALEHGSLAALVQACVPALPELKGMLRSLLHYHLGSPNLRTRQLMLEVQALDR
jgi:DNA repair protein RecO (recombination protein O)